jgi:hypothetical protein
MRVLTVAFCGLAVSACSASLTPAQRQAAEGVRLIDGEPPPGFVAVTEVEGDACVTNTDVSPTPETARYDLKLQAARVGATVVANIYCVESGMDLGSNCWKTLMCRGDAGNFSKGAPAR